MFIVIKAWFNKMNMNYDIPIPNINDAKEEMWRQAISADENYGFYNEYYPCLTMTNEYQQIMQTKNHINKNTDVLTVSGSGEQPLFFRLFGAKNVLTFDVSYNSYLMTQLKIAALKTYDNPQDYFNFLTDLYYTEDTDFIKTERINRVINNLPDIYKNYLAEALETVEVFYTNTCCDRYRLSETNYSKLRKIVKTPFPFILSDIKNLDKKLKGQKFDVVYYSNICSYLHPYDVRPVLNKTKEYLKPNGKLFLVTSYGDKKDDITDAIDDTFGFQSAKFFRAERGFYLTMVRNVQGRGL